MKYISYRESTIDEKTRKIHNQQYIKKQLIQQKEYFDNMFKNIDETIYLDEEQRKIILTDENNVMIIAGAGSGLSTITHSVVKSIPATEAAFSRATRSTLAGSTIPSARRSS